MSILEKEVWVGLSTKTIAHFEKLGYKIPKEKNKKGEYVFKKGVKMFVKTEDLIDTSPVTVTKVCDEVGCGEIIPNVKYRTITHSRKTGDGKDRCKKCYNKKGSETRRKNYINKYGSIADNHPEFAKLLWNEEDAFKYTYNSDSRADFRCPRCNCKIKNKIIHSVFNSGLSCSRCSDGKSYPEKFVTEILCQLSVDYQTQRRFVWSDNKTYDFYIESVNSIIEVNGKQHYVGGFEHYGKQGRNKMQEQENDRYKMNNALENKISKYIVIDASESTLEYIRNSVLNSYLINMFDLSNINWNKCHEYACSTLVKVACDMWNEGYGTTSEIGKVLKVTGNTIASYLRQGNDIGWCNYDPIESKRKTSQNSKKGKRGVVQLTEDGKLLSTYESISDAQKETGIHRSNITRVCISYQKTAGNYQWMYKDDYDKYIENENSILV